MNAIVRAAETNVGNPTLNIAVFAIFVVVTLFIVIRASRRNATAADFRAVPGAIVRRSAYIAPKVVLMPSFVNLGAYVDDASTQVDGGTPVSDLPEARRQAERFAGRLEAVAALNIDATQDMPPAEAEANYYAANESLDMVA